MTFFQYRLLNFSVGLKLYHERVCAEVNRAGTSQQKERVNKAFSELYDTNFGYRLVYSLRNAYLHGVRDLVHVHGTKRKVQRSDGTSDVANTVKVELHREAFSNSRTNGRVRKEVRDSSEIADLRNLCMEAYDGVCELHPRLMKIIYPHASEAAQIISSYMEYSQGERLHFMTIKPESQEHIFSIKTLDEAGFQFVLDQTSK